MTSVMRSPGAGLRSGSQEPKGVRGAGSSSGRGVPGARSASASRENAGEEAMPSRANASGTPPSGSIACASDPSCVSPVCTMNRRSPAESADTSVRALTGISGSGRTAGWAGSHSHARPAVEDEEWMTTCPGKPDGANPISKPSSGSTSSSSSASRGVPTRCSHTSHARHASSTPMYMKERESSAHAKPYPASTTASSTTRPEASWMTHV